MSRELFSEYKPSWMEWLDELPKHWGVDKLKYNASVQFSSVDKHSIEGEEPVRLCNYVDVYYNDFISSELDFMSATATWSEIFRFQIRNGDVLVTKDSESWDDIAIPAYVDMDNEGVLCGYHLAQIRPDSQRLLGKYLFYAFLSRGLNDQFQVAATGITRYGLGKYWLDNGLFPIPPLEQQHKIATFLDRETARIDTLIEKKQRQIELLQEKRSALISDAVTKGLNPNVKMRDSGIDWLGQVPVHWHHRKLGFIADITGGSTPNKANEAYWTGEIPWVSPKDMKKRIICDSEDHLSEEAILSTTLHLIKPPIVLIVVRGMILAHTFPVALTTVPVTINQDMKALNPKSGINADFLAFLLEGVSSVILSHIEESAHGTKCLRTEQWKNINLFMPDESEQIQICNYLHAQNSKLEQLIVKVENSLERLHEYRTALISATVTGKIDVRREAS